MNNEIKFDHFENINELLEHIDLWHEEEDIYYERWFGLNDLKKLKDYITNLQEELKSIKSNYKIQLEYDEELEDYKSRNEKAIEIIKTYSNMLDTRGVLLYSNLLNVLQGSDKE